MASVADDSVSLSVLARFHREVILPDIEEVVTRAVGDAERRQNARFDDLYHRL